MKKFIGFLLFIVMLSSCSNKYNYETTITYKIYYPNNTVVKHYTEASTDHPNYFLGSDRGSNYLYFNSNGSWLSGYGKKLEKTSAPIEVVSFVKSKK